MLFLLLKLFPSMLLRGLLRHSIVIAVVIVIVDIILRFMVISLVC